MSNSTNPKSTPAQSDSKPGFLTQIIRRLDDLLKKKADEASRKGSCCGGDKKDSDKCC